jgi:hypothetical protein
VRYAPFLIVTVFAEAATGLLLLVVPGFLLLVLLGVRDVGPEAHFVGRIAGAALLWISVAAWLARNDDHTRAQRGVLAGALFYNAVLVVLLGFAGTDLKLVGIALWPAAAYHLAMTVWGAACLRG